MRPTDDKQRWAARPVQAVLIRGFVLLAPIAGSVYFVHIASGVVAVPSSSFLLFISWWAVMSGAATLVLIGVDRVTRRLLPLAALYKLSLVFPDAAPSRFRTALRSNTVSTLEQRLAKARTVGDHATPIKSAEQLLALVAELDSHDRLTRGHSERVRAYSQMIAQELHLSPHELDLVNWAALLHDVGKLNVPSEILTKPGRPTDDEWNVLRRHPEFGEELVEPLDDWLGEWLSAVGEHHERWDGAGYPRGLEGEEISLAGRIVAVADVFDVITSARSYKSAFVPAKGRDEIARCAGSQFDPRIVRAFLNISLGRLRLVMGPLSWLAHAPLLARMPLTPALGTVTASLGTAAAALTTGIVAAPPPPAVAATRATPVVAHAATRNVQPSRPRHAVPRVRRAHPKPRQHVRVASSGGSPVAAVPAAVVPVASAPTPTQSQSPPQPVTAEASPPSAPAVVPADSPPEAVADHAWVVAGDTVAVAVLANDSDPDGDALSLTFVGTPPRGAARRIGDRVAFHAPPNARGQISFPYEISDPAGATARSTVTVRVVPAAGQGFTAGPDQTLLEDSGAQSLPGWASAIDGGIVGFDVRTEDPTLFATPPAVSPDGTLTYAVAPDANGRTNVSVRARADDGASGVPATFRVAVVPVNDAPTFNAGADQTAFENAGPQNVAGWATSISAGPADEASQRVGFRVVNDHASLFSAQPAITADGALSYTPATNAHGAATVVARAEDDGGTANGGVDSSKPRRFTITLEHLNHAPIATADVATVAEDEASGVTFNVLVNDTDVDAGDTLALASYDASALVGGTLTNNGGGSFTYVPDAGFTGTDLLHYVVQDGSGATSSGSATITVTAAQHAPVAGNDSYATVQDTPLTIAAPGVLANDGDPDGDPITIVTTPVSAPANGIVALAADGSFTYTPSTGYTGTDSFSYEIRDGTGRSAVGAVSITVSSVVASPSTFYFQSSGPSADVWDMTTALPPALSLLTDLDGDGKPGLTIRNSKGDETETRSGKYQTWTYVTPSPLTLDGPVTLELWSSSGLFVSLKAGTLYTYLYDCTAGAATCTKIAANTAFASPWNTSLLSWGHRVVTIGSVTRTIPAGHELRVKLLFRSADLWVTMTAAYPTALVVTG